MTKSIQSPNIQLTSYTLISKEMSNPIENWCKNRNKQFTDDHIQVTGGKKNL